VQDFALGARKSRSLKELFASFFGLGVSLRVHRGDESDLRMVGRNIKSIVVDPVAIVTRKDSAFMTETVNVFLFVHKYHAPICDVVLSSSQGGPGDSQGVTEISSEANHSKSPYELIDSTASSTSFV